MLVTTGKVIKIEIDGIHLERSCETPGKVSVKRNDRGGGPQYLDLPGNPLEAERFIEAYRRALAEDIPYRKMESE